MFNIEVGEYYRSTLSLKIVLATKLISKEYFEAIDANSNVDKYYANHFEEVPAECIKLYIDRRWIVDYGDLSQEMYQGTCL